MAILHMKISDPLLEHDLDFLRFPKHKTGLGGKIPRPGVIMQLFYGTITYENISSLVRTWFRFFKIS